MRWHSVFTLPNDTFNALTNENNLNGCTLICTYSQFNEPTDRSTKWEWSTAQLEHHFMCNGKFAVDRTERVIKKNCVGKIEWHEYILHSGIFTALSHYKKRKSTSNVFFCVFRFFSLSLQNEITIFLAFVQEMKQNAKNKFRRARHSIECSERFSILIIFACAAKSQNKLTQVISKRCAFRFKLTDTNHQDDCNFFRLFLARLSRVCTWSCLASVFGSSSFE